MSRWVNLSAAASITHLQDGSLNAPAAAHSAAAAAAAAAIVHMVG